MFKYRKPMLMIRDPVICNQVFTRYFEYFRNRPGPPVDINKNPLSNHLINMHGDQWKVVHSKLTPAFTPSKLKNMFDDIQECVMNLSDFLHNEIKINDEIEVIDLFSQFDLKVAGKCILGLNSAVLNNPNSKFNRIFKSLFKPTLTSKSKQILKFLFPQYSKHVETKNISRETYSFLNSILRDAVAFRETRSTKRHDFLKLLTDIHAAELSTDVGSNVSKDSLTESIILSNLFVFLTTGYESTSSTIASVLYELALNQDVQQKVRQEVEENMTQWSYNSLSNLKYLDQVISESQRLHPVNTSLSRQCTVEKFKLPGTEIWIPRGTHICIPTFAMYKDPKYFPEPDRFNPDRFSKEKSDQISKVFLPFGEGPRQCIAKRFALIEVKSVISNLILNFNFVPCSKTEIPLTYIPDKLFITPVNGIWIRFKLRV
ncbi:hypothetical protein M8J76_009651 [Diaphorina citri]|nr:hypothetical protein M8J76_009651 [Diaphorina citri]KAI5751487.1 hypothetical protein M8J77_007938 [Diaphorina citri]